MEPAENEDRDRRLNMARRSCAHGLPLRELGGPVAVRFPVDWSLKAPWGGNLEKKRKKKKKPCWGLQLTPRISFCYIVER